VPASAPRTKLDAIRALIGDVVLTDDYDTAERRAKEDAAHTGAVFMSPYSDPDVIAGAGTVALEIYEDCPDLATVVVPIGGGGLTSGVALALEGTGATVIGVEARASCPFTRGIERGRIVHIDVAPTIADGLAGNLDPDTVTFEIVRRLVHQIEVVSEEEIRSAVRGLLDEERLIAEGAAAVAVAGARRLRPGGGRQKIAVVVSGANIDADKLKEII
jgi:threonine dehydratase